MARKKKRPKQQTTGGAAPAHQGPALSPEEQSARREQQKQAWAARKRAAERARRSSVPLVWGGVAVGSLAAMAILGVILFTGGGGEEAATPTPAAIRDPRLGPGEIARSYVVDADDEGQEANPTFSLTTLTGNAGEIIEIKMNNIGNVAHNLNFAGLDGEYGSRDDWTTTPQTIQPGESGTVLVKFDEPGMYPFQCDFHPRQQRGNLILS